MQFYPHNVPPTTIGLAVSASMATSASFINNFAGIAINTASLALNITGSAGTPGTSVAVLGPTGSQGARGVTGFRGDSIFLLSSSWSGSACGSVGDPCLGPITLYALGPGFDECRTDQGSVTYYTTSSLSILNSNMVGDADGVILYTNSVCSSVAVSNAIHNTQGVVFYTDGAGVITTTGCAS